MTYAVLSSTHSTRVDLEDFALDLRVMQQPQGVVAHIHIAIKELLVQAHAHSDGPHDFDVQLLALVKEAEHIGPEIGHGAVFGPLVWESVDAFTANLVALLQIWRRSADLLDIVDFLELGDLFSAWRRVSAIGLGRCPAEIQLIIERLVEEARRRGEGMLEVIERDRVVLQVDEARRLEAMEDCLGRLGALCGRSAEEAREVDELVRGLAVS